MVPYCKQIYLQYSFMIRYSLFLLLVSHVIIDIWVPASPTHNGALMLERPTLLGELQYGAKCNVLTK